MRRDKCRTVVVDGEHVRIRSQRAPSKRDRKHLDEIVRAARKRAAVLFTKVGEAYPPGVRAPEPHEPPGLWELMAVGNGAMISNLDGKRLAIQARRRMHDEHHMATCFNQSCLDAASLLASNPPAVPRGRGKQP